VKIDRIIQMQSQYFESLHASFTVVVYFIRCILC